MDLEKDKAEASIIKTDYTMKELEKHGTEDFPVLISCGLTLSLERGIVSWHWHDDFELTYIVSGHFQFSVNDDVFLLGPGEAVFLNSRVLHQVKPVKNETPVYYSYAFSPELISESMHSLIAAKYILPLMHNEDFPYHIFRNQIPWEECCLSHIHALNRVADESTFEREFMILHYLQAVFIDLIQNLPQICIASPHSRHREYFDVMQMMLYIKGHFAEQVSLSDIAAAANISKSSCNRIFHRTLKMTPFAFLLEYRINQSKELLCQSTTSITDIAYSCGFHDVSYYCKIFRKLTGFSPQKYRGQMSEGASN